MSEIYNLQIPSLSETTREVKLLRFLKAVGERVEADTDLVEVETNKAVIEISSPFSGTLSKVFFDTGDTAKVGDIVLQIELDVKRSEKPDNFGQVRKVQSSNQTIDIKPKSDSVRTSIKQSALIDQLKISRGRNIPATIETQIEWSIIEVIKRSSNAHSSDRPGCLGIFTWALSQAMNDFKKFKARLNADNVIEFSSDCLIGIARSEKDDDLETIVISVQAEHSFSDINKAVKNNVKCDSQTISKYHSVAISDMSAFDVQWGLPLVVYPAVATLFIGSPYWGFDKKGQTARVSNLVLSFDHQIINGAYAADFLRQVKVHLKALTVPSLEIAESLKVGGGHNV